jgi:DNA-binding NtrC family response regulator/ligand-binding sensor domain-containing protein
MPRASHRVKRDFIDGPAGPVLIARSTMTTLVRLAFRAPAARHRALARAFEDRLWPTLERVGLADPRAPDRRQVPDHFCRVCEVHDEDAAAALAADREWARLTGLVAGELGCLTDDFWRLTPYCATAGSGRSSEAGPGYHQGDWHCFGVQDGVPSSIVTGLARGDEGILWMTLHEGGICRFDGELFTSLTTADGLPHNHATYPVVTPSGDLWLITTVGLCRFDGETFHTYTEEDGVPPDHLRMAPLVARDGSVWVAGAGLSRFDGTSFRPVPGDPPGAAIRCLAEDASGTIWMGTASGGLWQYDGTALTCRATPGALPAGAVLRLDVDATGRLWVTTETASRCLERGQMRTANQVWPAMPHEGEVTYLADGPERTWVAVAGRVFALDGDGQPVVQHEVPWQQVHRLADRAGRLWLADGSGGGVLRLDDQRAMHYTTREGIGHNRVYALLEDEAGHVWIGSWGGGLNRFDGDRLRAFTTADGLTSDEVEDLCFDSDGALWFATRTGGACRLRGAQFDAPLPEGDLDARLLWCVATDRRNRLWVGSAGAGAGCWDGEQLRRLTTADGLPDADVWDIVEDRRGRLWFATRGGGAACLDGDDLQHFGEAQGLPSPYVWSVAEDRDGGIWFCTMKGLARWDGESCRVYTAADGLAHDNVWCVHVARDERLWFGTWGGGVCVWDPDDESFLRYTVADGLVDNNVRCLAEDDAGRLWFGTYGGGVSIFDGRVFQSLSRKDGLVHDAVQAIRFAADGSAWIATEAGVTRYDARDLPPRVRLHSVIADRTYGPQPHLSMPSSQAFLLIEFRGRSATTPRQALAYEARLQGVDEDWRTLYEPRVRYDALPIGRHRFEVRAVDRDLRRSAPARLDIEVHADTQQDRLAALQAELSQSEALDPFVGTSASLQRVLDGVHTVAGTDVTVLVLGETGTGKGLAARAIHAMSERAAGPFLQVNCGAIPEGLVESELFGHEKGAFTGAVSRKIGRFELAEGGTLFLDEIGDLPLESQRVLLHVLQDGLFQRVGGRESMQADARVVAATNRDLREAMRQGTFREDLYFRLSPFVLRLPPLRDRRQDIPLLVQHFVEHYAHELRRSVPAVTDEALDYLTRYAWPGNVRELEHVVQRAILVCRDGVLRLDDLFLGGSAALGDEPPSISGVPGQLSLDEHRRHLDAEHRRFIEAALEQTGGVIYGERGAARLLGTHPEKLRVRMRSLGIDRAR